MKLGKVTTNDPYVRTTIKLRQSTMDQLELYREYYKKVYGDEISVTTLLEEMAKAFLKDDKGFQKYETELVEELKDSDKPIAPAKGADKGSGDTSK